MTLLEARQQLLMCLFENYNSSEAEAIADMALESLTGLPRIERLMNKQMPISATQQSRLNEIIQQLAQHKPIQYIINEAWFYGLRFTVNEAVLIPRPETEELVEWILKDVESHLPSSIIDIGTGSGCIATTLKYKLPAVSISAVDIAVASLAVAKENAALNDVKIDWQQMNFLNESEWGRLGMFDVIVSNPPYVKQSEAETMLPHVIQYEPHVALFVPDNDALIFYKALAKFSKQHLNSNGALYVEINEALATEVEVLLKSNGFSTVEIKKDLQGKWRMVKAY
jgi:release factor glutamine methyltransferase